MSWIAKDAVAMRHPEGLPLARTLVFAPHPDDESIGAGALLAHVAKRGASVRIVYLTSGENNPWPQRASRRRWRISANDRREWGRRRRAEARCALIRLGISPKQAKFLGFPDDGLASVNRRALVPPILEVLDEFRPTLLVIPSIHDLHSDHRAACRAIMQAVTASANKPALTLSYVIHGTRPAQARRRVEASDEERAQKRRAIEHHATQLLLSRRRLLRYAAREEEFAVVTDFAISEETWLAAMIAKVLRVLSLL